MRTKNGGPIGSTTIGRRFGALGKGVTTIGLLLLLATFGGGAQVDHSPGGTRIHLVGRLAQNIRRVTYRGRIPDTGEPSAEFHSPRRRHIIGGAGGGSGQVGGFGDLLVGHVEARVQVGGLLEEGLRGNEVTIVEGDQSLPVCQEGEEALRPVLVDRFTLRRGQLRTQEAC